MHPNGKVLLLCPWLLLAPSWAAADQEATTTERHLDHREARMLVESGRIHPLRWILAQVPERDRQRVVGVELEVEHGRYIYEIQTLSSHGRVSQIRIDAAKGTLVRAQRDR